MPDWGTLGRSEDIKALFESHEVEAYLGDQARELIQGDETDRHQIGLRRGRIESIRWLQSLCGRQADLVTRKNQKRSGVARVVRPIRDSLRP